MPSSRRVNAVHFFCSSAPRQRCVEPARRYGGPWWRGHHHTCQVFHHHHHHTTTTTTTTTLVRWIRVQPHQSIRYWRAKYGRVVTEKSSSWLGQYYWFALKIKGVHGGSFGFHRNWVRKGTICSEERRSRQNEKNVPIFKYYLYNRRSTHRDLQNRRMDQRSSIRPCCLRWTNWERWLRRFSQMATNSTVVMFRSQNISFVLPDSLARKHTIINLFI